MEVRKFAIFLSTLILFCSIAFAQATTPTMQPSDPSAETDAAKKKKELDERIMQMLDQAVGEANALRLPQNKALMRQAYQSIANKAAQSTDEARAQLERSVAEAPDSAMAWGNLARLLERQGGSPT